MFVLEELAGVSLRLVRTNKSSVLRKPLKLLPIFGILPNPTRIPGQTIPRGVNQTGYGFVTA